MRTRYLAVLVLAGLGVVTPGVEAAVRAPPGFGASYEKALEQAKKDNKPIYLHFTTDWCGFCRKIESEVYTNEKAREALTPFVRASLDCSQNAAAVKGNQALWSKFGGKGYPFIVILAPDGAVLTSWSGYVPLERFVERLERAEKKFDEYNAFLQKAKTADPKNIDFQLEALDVYVATQQWNKADIAARESIKLDTDRAHLARVKVAQLQVAKSRKSAQLVTVLSADIRKLDPDNAGNHLEDALREQADALMVMASRQTQAAQYKKAQALLTERTTLQNLRSPVQAMGDLVRFQAGYGNFDDAWTTLKKMQAEHADDQNAAYITSLADWVKETEAKQKK